MASVLRPMLYTNPICPFAHRALMTVVEKGLTNEIDTTMIPLSLELKTIAAAGSVAVSSVWKNQGKSPEELQKIKDDYKLTVNATGEVPSLVIEGQLLCVSYSHRPFEHRHPHTPFPMTDWCFVRVVIYFSIITSTHLFIKAA